MKTNCKIEKLEGITIEIAQTLIEIFEKLYHITLEIKYPNDIVVGTKKIGGILTQTRLKAGKVIDMVIGIGVNTNQEEFAEEIKDTATSIKKEFAIEIDNRKVISQFCNRFERKLEKRIKGKT